MPIRLAKYLQSRVSGRVTSMPVMVLMPHSRCNCRCTMCDIWKANHDKRELTTADLAPHLDTFRRLGVRWIVLSGGEPLMHSNLWLLCAELKALGVRLTLLSTGLLLADNAPRISASCDEVIVSLDGSRDVHNDIRNIPDAYERLAEGVRTLKAAKPNFRVTGRSVLQRRNFFDLLNIVAAAKEIGLDGISFLAADVSSHAFNRPAAWTANRVDTVALDDDEIGLFAALVGRLIHTCKADIRSGFIAESAEKLQRLPQYYSAIRNRAAFPPNRCNAPWVSAVIEADGTVRPCFFHSAFGNIHRQPLDAILNGDQARAFRKRLDILEDPICRKCVCTLNLSPLAGFGP